MPVLPLLNARPPDLHISFGHEGWNSFYLTLDVCNVNTEN